MDIPLSSQEQGCAALGYWLSFFALEGCPSALVSVEVDSENHGDMSEEYRLCWGKSSVLFQHLHLPTPAHRCKW